MNPSVTHWGEMRSSTWELVRTAPALLRSAFALVMVQAPPDSTVSARPDAALPLSRAVQRAHVSHPSVRAAHAEAAAAEAAVGLPAADRWPHLRAQAGLTEYEEPNLVRPIHALTPEALEFDQTLTRTDATLSWTLYDGGTTGARVRGARADAAGAAAGEIATGMALTSEVVQAYLDVLTTRGVLDAQEQHLAALAAERMRVQQLLDQGRAARVELLRVDAARAEVDADRVATATQLDLAERTLARLVDLPADSTRASRLQPVRLIQNAPPEDRTALVDQARAANPELQRSRRHVESAAAAHRAALGAWIPTLGAFGSWLGYGTASSDLTLEWQAGVSISYPLFTAGARRSAVRRAAEQAGQAREELRLDELQSDQQVDQALGNVQATHALVDAIALTVQAQTEVARIERLSLEAGAGTQTDYLNAQSDLHRARSALVRAGNGEVAAFVELARVLGTLTPEWIDRNLEIAR
jgi:outer membrane protein